MHEFEHVVNAFAVRDDIDLYITGSNAFFLSSELATLLTGRYGELRMLPFSFSEYRLACATGASADEDFDRYLTHGGMPFTTTLDDTQSIADYLGGVFNTIILEDVTSCHPRMDMRAFGDLSRFIADNVGNITS